VHRKFRELLDVARGQSEFVLAVNLDIRGFSAWSQQVESSQTTLYLTKMYRTLIDTYFGSDWFFKPTGDGLLLVRAFTEDELGNVAARTASDAFEIVEAFDGFLRDEAMLNFAVPGEIGVGLARGAATRLVAHDPNSGTDVTLDYSGRVLNLASRLMELARPRGVVIADSYGVDLLSQDLRNRLVSADGYVRGVATDDLTRIWYAPELTTIPASFSRAPDEPMWHTQTFERTLKSIEDSPIPRRVTLEREPADPSLIRCRMSRQNTTQTGRPVKNSLRYTDTPFEYAHESGEHVVRVDTARAIEGLRKAGVKGTWPLEFRVEYPVRRS